jgi:hypothetical protein
MPLEVDKEAAVMALTESNHRCAQASALLADARGGLEQFQNAVRVAQQAREVAKERLANSTERLVSGLGLGFGFRLGSELGLTEPLIRPPFLSYL